MNGEHPGRLSGCSAGSAFRDHYTASFDPSCLYQLVRTAGQVHVVMETAAVTDRRFSGGNFAFAALMHGGPKVASLSPHQIIRKSL